MDIFHSGSRFEPTVQIESGKLRMFDFSVSSLFSQAIPPLKKKGTLPSYRFNKFQSNDFPVPPNCLLRVSNKNN